MPHVRNNPQYQENPHAQFSIFSHLDQIWCPEQVYIFGAAPSVKKWLKWIKPTYNIALVALNRLIKEDVEWSHWVVHDTNAMSFDWAHLESPEGCCVLMGNKIADERATYTFDDSRRMSYSNTLMNGCILNNATVAGSTCQILHHAKPKGQDLTITLFGCDFRGGKHFDGSSAGRQGGIWWQKKYMDHLIQALRNRGTIVVSATPTALNCPFIEVRQ